MIQVIDEIKLVVKLIQHGNTGWLVKIPFVKDGMKSFCSGYAFSCLMLVLQVMVGTSGLCTMQLLPVYLVDVPQIELMVTRLSKLQLVPRTLVPVYLKE